jgi:hypothetical protein
MGRPRKHKSNLPPSVFKSHGAYYHVVNGMWHPLGKSLPDALAEYGRRVQPVEEGQLNALIEAAFTRMKKRKTNPLAANTVKQYTIASKKLKHLLRKFSSPQQVKQKDAAQVKMLLAPTPNMANRVLAFGRQVFADLVEQQVIDSNPFLGVRRHTEAKRDRLYSWEESAAIYAKAGARLQVIMDLLFLTDQRIGDVLKIDLRECEGAGVMDAHMHDGRAFSATEAKRQGLDPQKTLGHDDPRTTKIYLRGKEVEVVYGPVKRAGVLGA